MLAVLKSAVNGTLVWSRQLQGKERVVLVGTKSGSQPALAQPRQTTKMFSNWTGYIWFYAVARQQNWKTH